jgi:hypothetical protein
VVVILRDFKERNDQEKSNNEGAQFKVKENSKSIYEAFVVLSLLRLADFLVSSVCNDVFLRVKKYQI